MTDNTTENFLKAWQEWVDTPQIIAPIFYRLYYNDNGLPLFYSMEDLPGNYIDITPEQFVNSSPHVRVINGKLVQTTLGKVINKLKPDPDNGIPCHPTDVCVVVSTNSDHIKWKNTYEN